MGTRDREADARHLSAFGQQLRELRTSLRYSQEQLAQRAGLDRSVVGYIERGEREVGITTVWLLADALGVPAAALFDIPELRKA